MWEGVWEEVEWKGKVDWLLMLLVRVAVVVVVVLMVVLMVMVLVVELREEDREWRVGEILWTSCRCLRARSRNGEVREGGRKRYAWAQ